MNPESLPTIIIATSSAALLAPAIKKLTLAAAQGLSLLKRNQTPLISDPIDIPAVHQTLAEVDQLLIDLQSTLHSPPTATPATHASPTPPAPHTAGQPANTISQADHEITEMVDSIHDLVDEVRQLAGPTTATAEGTPSPARQAVGEVLGSILAFGGTKRSARIFILTGPGNFDTSGSAYTIKIAGNLGSQQLTFASGTSQAQIITAINQFKPGTGVFASQDKKTDKLVELRSVKRGARFFVAARRISGNLDDILYDERRSHPANLQIDFGEK